MSKRRETALTATAQGELAKKSAKCWQVKVHELGALLFAWVRE